MGSITLKEHRKSLTWCYYNRGEYTTTRGFGPKNSSLETY